jgi:hypothetical protein
MSHFKGKIAWEFHIIKKRTAVFIESASISPIINSQGETIILPLKRILLSEN